MHPVLGAHQLWPSALGQVVVVSALAIDSDRHGGDERHAQGLGPARVDGVQQLGLLVEGLAAHPGQPDPVDRRAVAAQQAHEGVDTSGIDLPPPRRGEAVDLAAFDDALLVVGPDHHHGDVDVAPGQLLGRLLLDVDVVVAGQARGGAAELDHLVALAVAKLAIESGPEAVSEGVAEHPDHHRPAGGDMQHLNRRGGGGCDLQRGRGDQRMQQGLGGHGGQHGGRGEGGGVEFVENRRAQDRDADAQDRTHHHPDDEHRHAAEHGLARARARHDSAGARPVRHLKTNPHKPLARTTPQLAGGKVGQRPRDFCRGTVNA